MIKLRKITETADLKIGMTILTVDCELAECLERIDCIDNGKIWTFGLADGWMTRGEDLETYISCYESVYEVTT